MSSSATAYIALAIVGVCYLLSKVIPPAIEYYKSLSGQQRGHRFSVFCFLFGPCLIAGNATFLHHASKLDLASNTALITMVCSGVGLGLGIAVLILAIAILLYWHAG